MSRSGTTRSWLAWFVLVGCALLAASDTIDVARTVQSARWQSVTGTIIASSDQSDMVGVKGNRPVYLRRLHLTYDYEVDGRKYESSQVSRLAAYVSVPTRRDSAQYATGHPVVVHYDPKAPATAVIDISLPWGRCIRIALAALVFTLVWRGTRLPRRR